MAATLACSGSRLPYQNPKLSLDARVEDLLNRLTPAERGELVHFRAVPRLGIPAVKLPKSSVGLSLEATWDPDLVLRLGRALGPDAPAFAPQGADPWLESRIAVAWVSGVQTEGGIGVLTNLPCDGGSALSTFHAAVEEAGLWAIEAGQCPGAIDPSWGFRGFAVPSEMAEDEQALRIVRALFGAGSFDGGLPKIDPSERTRLQRTAAEESVVLLKNEAGLLPLFATRLRSIAVEGAKTQIDAIRARTGATPVVEGSGDAEVSIAFHGDRIEVRSGQNSALLEAWNPQGATDVIFGDVNPSGHLPAPTVDFPFGSGLSYTSFEWSNLRIMPVTPRYGQLVQVVAQIRNTGSRAGAETVQLYLAGRLKAFARVELKPGESKNAAMTLDSRALTDPGEYELGLGASSRDIRLKGSLRLFP